MVTYRITDPQTGKTLRVEGDSPPTEQELNDIFSQTRTAPTSLGQAVGGPLQGPIDFLTGGIQKLPGAIQQSVQAQHQYAPKTLEEAINPLKALQRFGSAMAPLAGPSTETAADISMITGIPGLMKGGVKALTKTPEFIQSLPSRVSPTKAWAGAETALKEITDTITHTDLAQYLKNKLATKVGKASDQPNVEKEIENFTSSMAKRYAPDVTKGIEKGVPLKMSNLLDESTKLKYDPTSLKWENDLYDGIKRELKNIVKEKSPEAKQYIERYGPAKAISNFAPQNIARFITKPGVAGGAIGALTIEELVRRLLGQK